MRPRSESRVGNAVFSLLRRSVRAALVAAAAEHEQVKVDVEIERAAEALDQRHGADHAACARETRLANQMARDRPIDDAEHLRHDLGPGRKQIAQRKSSTL